VGSWEVLATEEEHVRAHRPTRTVTATTESPDGMTLDELAGLLRRAMAAGIDPHTPIRVRTRRNGAVVSASVEGVASGV
jgi:hypothetical protein